MGTLFAKDMQVAIGRAVYGTPQMTPNDASSTFFHMRSATCKGHLLGAQVAFEGHYLHIVNTAASTWTVVPGCAYGRQTTGTAGRLQLGVSLAGSTCNPFAVEGWQATTAALNASAKLQKQGCRLINQTALLQLISMPFHIALISIKKGHHRWLVSCSALMHLHNLHAHLM